MFIILDRKFSTFLEALVRKWNDSLPLEFFPMMVVSVPASGKKSIKLSCTYSKKPVFQLSALKSSVFPHCCHRVLVLVEVVQGQDFIREGNP